MVNKILFITLSNIGDVILTLPVLDTLREDFPRAKITVISGPRPKGIFENNPLVDKLIVFDKHKGLRYKIGLLILLKKEKFDAVIDLRNGLFGFLLAARYKTSPFRFTPKNLRHMRERHLYKIKSQKSKVKGQKAKIEDRNNQIKSIYVNAQDEEYIENILKEKGILPGDKIIIISPGARSHIKRWPKEKFAALVSKLFEEFHVKIILAGDKDDSAVCEYITKNCTYPVIDLCAKTTIRQLAYLLNKAQAVIGNDSAVLHLASYLNVPVAAIFGPTNELKYGPWSNNSVVVKKDIFCRPCEKAQCRFRTVECMALIKEQDILRGIKKILSPEPRAPSPEPRKDFKRILIVRTDRIGDVVLSTPVISALRDNYPNAYITMMVGRHAKEIVHNNPCLDQVIVYDKDYKHKGWISSIKFAWGLRKMKFDLALILHPSNRSHWAVFFAGIPKRIGYDRKFGFLLTDRITHTKHLGEKHESQYALDFVRYLILEPKETRIFMPINPESEKWADELFVLEGIGPRDKLLGIHPAASCPSKIWPVDRFAETADKLAELYGFKVLIFSGAKDVNIAVRLKNSMKHKAINLAGKTSISQLASLLKRCNLFISNDSGPVHIASAVGTPVISIFGRDQKGLSPKRWGPLGQKDKVLHKEVGCIECLAHNCVKEFSCLKAITVNDVLTAVDSILVKPA